MEEMTRGPISTMPNISLNVTFIFNNTEPLYEIPTSLSVVFIIMYITIVLLGAGGNSLTIYVIIKSRRMRTVTNMYIANLAVADFILTVLAMPFQFQAMLSQRWDLPPFLCDLCPAVVVLSVNLSVLTLTCISLDRYQAVLNPLTHKPTLSFTKLVIFSIWVISLALALPLLEFYEFENVLMDGEGKPFCHPKNRHLSTLQAYNIILIVVDYIIPMIIISISYSRISCRLWCSPTPGVACSARDAAITSNKKKAVRMMMVVVLLFCICWLPYQLYFLLEMQFPINEYKYINVLFILSHWLAMSNSCFNPIIYAIYCSKFRQEFGIVLKLRQPRPTTDYRPSRMDTREMSPSTQNALLTETSRQVSRLRSKEVELSHLSVPLATEPINGQFRDQDYPPA